MEKFIKKRRNNRHLNEVKTEHILAIYRDAETKMLQISNLHIRYCFAIISD